MLGGSADETWGWGVRRPWIGTPGSASPCPFVSPGGLTASGKGMNGGGKKGVGGEYGTGDASAHLPRPRGAVSGTDQVGQGSYVTLFCRRRHPAPVSATGERQKGAQRLEGHLQVQGGSRGGSTSLCLLSPFLLSHTLLVSVIPHRFFAHVIYFFDQQVVIKHRLCPRHRQLGGEQDKPRLCPHRTSRPVQGHSW